jgi:hypothetical protein
VLKQELYHPTLPLAKVGRDAWVPLEMLRAHHTQFLPTSVLSTDLLRDVLKEDELESKSQQMKDFADDAISKVFAVCIQSF